MASTSDLFTDTENGGPPEPTTASAERTAGATTLECEALTNWPTNTKVFFVTGTPTTDAEGNPIINPETLCLWYGIVSGSNLVDLTLTGSPADADPGNNIGDLVQMAPTSTFFHDMFEGATAEHNTTGNHTAITANSVTINSTGIELGNTALTGWAYSGEVPTYNSANAINVASGAKYQIGWRIQITQSSTVKYGVITAISGNVLTVWMLNSTTVANSTISNFYFSMVQCPLGMESVLVTQYTNGGSGGGTTWYKINVDGTKELWGNTNGMGSSSTGGSNTWTLPTGFFNAIQKAGADMGTGSNTVQQLILTTVSSLTQLTFTPVAINGSSTSVIGQVHVIGN